MEETTMKKVLAFIWEWIKIVAIFAAVLGMLWVWLVPDNDGKSNPDYWNTHNVADRYDDIK